MHGRGVSDGKDRAIPLGGSNLSALRGDGFPLQCFFRPYLGRHAPKVLLGEGETTLFGVGGALLLGAGVRVLLCGVHQGRHGTLYGAQHIGGGTVQGVRKLHDAARHEPILAGQIPRLERIGVDGSGGRVLPHRGVGIGEGLSDLLIVELLRIVLLCGPLDDVHEGVQAPTLTLPVVVVDAQ